MRKIIVSEWITLDGVFDSDPIFFEKWFMPYHSNDRAESIQDGILGCDAILFGRKTYEMLAPYWSSLKNNEMGIADHMNSVNKYVVSKTLKTAEWNNSTIIRDDVVEEINKLKRQPDHDILIIGSATLVQSLMESDLIDEYRFLVHPIIMGTGKRFFKDETHTTKLKLIKTKALDLGVILLWYERAKTS
jgi:dihydrofolate reductase